MMEWYVTFTILVACSVILLLVVRIMMAMRRVTMAVMMMMMMTVPTSTKVIMTNINMRALGGFVTLTHKNTLNR